MGADQNVDSALKPHALGKELAACSKLTSGMGLFGRSPALLVLPLIAFLLVTFVVPVGAVLLRSVYDPDVSSALPNFSQSIGAWDGKGLPSEEVAGVLIEDLRNAAKNETLGQVAKRLNYNVAGFRALILKTGTRLQNDAAADGTQSPYQRLSGVDARWNQPQIWQYLQQASRSWTAFYLQQSLDLGVSEDGALTWKSDGIYLPLLLRTLQISAFVTLYCAILGFPLAYLLTSVSKQTAGRLMLLILLPFWTAVLVRTTAWMVLLQDNGLINLVGMQLGLWSSPLALIRNRTGVYIAMVHILLPFMVLPLYSVMAGIDRSQMKAAASLGAKPLRAFLMVFLPQATPGLVAGGLLVFILALGYYVTPALVGGASDQMISYYIAQHATTSLNWGMAAALSLVLITSVIVLSVLYRLASTKSQFGFGGK